MDNGPAFHKVKAGKSDSVTSSGENGITSVIIPSDLTVRRLHPSMNGVSGRTTARIAKFVFKCVRDKLKCHSAKCKGCVNGTAVRKRLCFL